jgi:hypothetical protein
MTSKIRTALQNCEQHESKIQSLVKKVSDSKLVMPLALTAGFVTTSALLGPAISSHLSSFGSLVADSFDSIQQLKESSPRIFYGLVGGLMAGGALLGAVGYLEHREEKKQRAAGLDGGLAANINAAWESIVQTNAAVTKRVAHHQAWAIGLFEKPSQSTAETLVKHGFNPSNRAAMLDLQRAYIQGVKNAFVVANEDGRKARIGGNTYDQYTNKNIMRGMVSYYKELGYSLNPGPNKTVLACDIVTSGLSAIRELALRDMVNPDKVLSRAKQAADTLSR